MSITSLGVNPLTGIWGKGGVPSTFKVVRAQDQGMIRFRVPASVDTLQRVRTDVGGTAARSVLYRRSIESFATRKFGDV